MTKRWGRSQRPMRMLSKAVDTGLLLTVGTSWTVLGGRRASRGKALDHLGDKAQGEAIIPVPRQLSRVAGTAKGRMPWHPPLRPSASARGRPHALRLGHGA